VIISNGTTQYDQVVNNDSSFSIFLIQQDNYLFAVAMSKELEDSMFTRLYFMQGEGLTRFKLAHEEPSEGIAEVMVWNVT
jgi:dolichyl-diphosphooligosaccharide--protein glycosyltransferase